jgi:hypothetical protein
MPEESITVQKGFRANPDFIHDKNNLTAECAKIAEIFKFFLSVLRDLCGEIRCKPTRDTV